MKIQLITPIYATTTQGPGATPVVHYFAKEWVKQGHDVSVIHLIPCYPRLYYWIGKKFQHQLNTRLGQLVPIKYPEERNYIADGVKVESKKLSHVIPHSRYSQRQINMAVSFIARQCEENGVPDIFIGHWDNPQLDVLCRLKQRFSKPVALVFHNNVFNLEHFYGSCVESMLKQLDYVGFRSLVAKRDFTSKYVLPAKYFMAYSGVSDSFIKAGRNQAPNFEEPVSKYVFVGSLIQRKFPAEILLSLSDVYKSEPYSITYIGDGSESTTIKDSHKRLDDRGEVNLTGRIPREHIIHHLMQSQVFVMVSKNEVFGLVYLEAMALGLIPIGSRDEGIDGIIVDGVNGFLCEAGNVEELTTIISKIRNMSSDELLRISNNAKKTAAEFSDSNVAKDYLSNFKQ